MLALGGTHREGTGVPGEPEKLSLDVRRLSIVISPVVLGVHVCEETRVQGTWIESQWSLLQGGGMLGSGVTQAWNGCK